MNEIDACQRLAAFRAHIRPLPLGGRRLNEKNMRHSSLQEFRCAGWRRIDLGFSQESPAPETTASSDELNQISTNPRPASIRSPVIALPAQRSVNPLPSAIGRG